MNIIPAIDIINGKCVRLTQGDYGSETVYTLTPLEAALTWKKQGAEFLHLVDLDGAKAGHPVNLDTIKKICGEVEIPCELGGGIRSVSDAEDAFAAGIFRIILGTIAVENKGIVDLMISRFGNEKIVIGIDAKNGRAATRGWIEETEVEAFSLAKEFRNAGVGRFIYTDISRDGAFTGPNYEAIMQFCIAVPECKVIASGGVGSQEDLAKLRELSLSCRNLESVIVGKALYESRIKLRECMER